MAEILKYVIDYFQAQFSGLAHKAAKEALPVAVKLVMDKLGGEERLTPEVRLKVQGLVLDALRATGFKGASDERGDE